MSLLKKSMLATAVLSAVAISTPSWAGPVVTLDVEVAGASLTTPSGINTVTGATAGQVINLQIWGILSDNSNYSGPSGPYTPATGDGLTTIQLRLVSQEGATSVTGNYSSGAESAVMGGAASGATHASYNGAGGADWGGAVPAVSGTSNYLTSSAAPTPAVFGGTNSNAVLVGTITYTVSASQTSNGGTVLLQSVPKIQNTNSEAIYSFTLGGTTYTNAAVGGTAFTTTVTNGPTWANGQQYDGASYAGRIEGPEQRMLIGTGVTVTAAAAVGGNDVINLASAASSTNTGTETIVDNGLPTNPVPPTMVAFGTAGTGLSNGSLSINNLVNAGNVYVLLHVIGASATSLNSGGHLPGGVTALDLTSNTFLNANADWKSLENLYGNMPNVGFLLSSAGGTANDFFNFDLGADSAKVDLAIAVPEPASLGLAAIGITALMMRRRRAM